MDTTQKLSQIFGIGLVLLCAACGRSPSLSSHSGSLYSASASSASTMTISPASIRLAAGAQYSVVVTDGVAPFTFKVVPGGIGGAVNPSGVFTAPSATGSTEVAAQDANGDTAYLYITVTAAANPAPTTNTAQTSCVASGGTYNSTTNTCSFVSALQTQCTSSGGTFANGTCTWPANLCYGVAQPTTQTCANAIIATSAPTSYCQPETFLSYSCTTSGWVPVCSPDTTYACNSYSGG